MGKVLNFLIGTARIRTAALILAGTFVLYIATRWNALFAVAFFYIIMVFGLKMLGGFSAPMAEPPPPGEMRKVKLEYRCDICGSEARMTAAPDEDPPALRHCLEDMILVTPVE